MSSGSDGLYLCPLSGMSPATSDCLGLYLKSPEHKQCYNIVIGKENYICFLQVRRDILRRVKPWRLFYGFFVEAAALLRSIILQYAGVPIDTCFFFFFLYVYLEMSSFSSIFCTIAVFSY